jgi:hypothetical protein
MEAWVRFYGLAQDERQRIQCRDDKDNLASTRLLADELAIEEEAQAQAQWTSPTWADSKNRLGLTLFETRVRSPRATVNSEFPHCSSAPPLSTPRHRRSLPYSFFVYLVFKHAFLCRFHFPCRNCGRQVRFPRTRRSCAIPKMELLA